MLKLNWGLIVCGVVGAIVAVALPLAEVGPVKVKLLDAGGQGYLVLGALLAGGAMGAINLFKAPARWTGGVAIAAFLLAGMKLSGGGEAAGAGANGGMMLAFVGALLAIAVTVKPGKRA
jgi:hypothetical protein